MYCTGYMYCTVLATDFVLLDTGIVLYWLQVLYCTGYRYCTVLATGFVLYYKQLGILS